MNKNLTIQMGNCHHRKYIPMLLPIVQSGTFDPSRILTQSEPMASVIEAYERFDQREQGWIKVMLDPRAA
jgi:threonine dehydrogenase-like Zn-dependent dehydrogenase